MQRALEHHAALFRIGRFGADHLRGSVHFTLARLSLHRGDLQGSVKELRIAARHLEGYWKAEALNALSREELEADHPEKAYAAALEGLQCKPPEYSRDWLDDDLRGNLAHALFLLRRYEEAKWELRDVIERGVYLSRKEWAARFLEMLEREFPGR